MQWHWLKGGVILGLVFVLAVLLVKPIGVSTQFVIFNGIVWNQVDDDLITKKAIMLSDDNYVSKNAYLNKSGGKYAKSVEKPVNYSFIFVIAMMLGALLSEILSSEKIPAQDKNMPQVWRSCMGESAVKRFLFAFMGGFLVLYGSRLAGGCTSGHMMSGMMQTSLSGWLFAIAAFATGIPVAMCFYKGKSGKKSG